MGFLRDAVDRFLDYIDPPPPPPGPRLPCPECGSDLLDDLYPKEDIDLTFYVCQGCGRATAVHWNDRGAHVIYPPEPESFDEW